MGLVEVGCVAGRVARGAPKWILANKMSLDEYYRE